MGAGHGEALSLLESDAPEGLRAVRVEADGLEPAELAKAVLRRLRIDSEAQDPWRRLEEAVRDLGDDGLLLLVSGASGMLMPTAAELRRSIDRLAGNLHVVLAMGPPNEASLAELAPISAEIQVGVLGPKPAAVRARRMLAGTPAGGRRTGAVTMAQLAKARRRREPGPEQGFTPGRAPGEPHPARPPEKAGMSPASAPFPAGDDVRRQARAPLQRPERPATNPDEKPPVPRAGWRRVFMSIAAALIVMGSIWWALEPEPFVDRAGDRDPAPARAAQEPQARERLPQVSVGPPRTERAVKPAQAPSPGAGAALPRPVSKKAAKPRPEGQVQGGKKPAEQAASQVIVDDSVELEPETQPLQAAPLVASEEPAPASQAAPDAGASEDATETPPEYVPPIVHDPKRVPEILRIGPPSSPAVDPPADGSEAPGALNADVLLVSIDAEPTARVHVDGRLLGLTPIPDARLRQGVHSFSIEFENGQVSERSVRVDAANQSFLFRLVPTGSRSPPRPGD